MSVAELTEAEIAAVMLPPHAVEVWQVPVVSLDASGIIFLASCLLPEAQSTLKTLVVCRNEIGAAGAAALATSLEKNTTLISLDISANLIGAAGAAALANSLEKDTILASLDVSANCIGDAGAAALATSLKMNATLTRLDISWNEFTDAGAAALAASLENNSTLAILNLRSNRIGFASAVVLATSLEKNTTLSSLDVADNAIGEAGAVALASCLDKNTTLTSLDVADNAIGAAGAAALATSLEKNMILTSLNVSDNAIGAAGAATLATSLEKNTTLTSINIFLNQVGDAGAIALATSLEKNATLTSLDISDNRVGDAGVAALAASMEKNSALTSLNAFGNQVGDNIRMTFCPLLESNRSQPQWRAMFALRSASLSSLDPQRGTVCVAVATSSSLARLLNEIIAKIDDHLLSFSGSASLCVLPVRLRRRISRLQLRVLDGTSLEPFASGADDSDCLRRACALSAPFASLRCSPLRGAPKLPASTADPTATTTPPSPACNSTADHAVGVTRHNDIHVGASSRAEMFGRDVYLAVSFGVVCVAFIFAIERNSHDPFHQLHYPSAGFAERVSKTTLNECAQMFIAANNNTSNGFVLPRTAPAITSITSPLFTTGTCVVSESCSEPSLKFCGAIPREVKTLLFAFIRA